jgi:iron complex transport system ATP-binding protein
VTVIAEDSHEWTSVDDLYRREMALDELVRAVQIRMGNCETRVAASLFHLGVAARLLSPQIGCLYLGRFSLDLSRQNTRWRTTGANFFELGILEPHGIAVTAGEPLIQQSINAVLADHLLPLTMALQSRTDLARGLLMGNIASALVGTARVLRPRLGASWIDIARQLVAQANLSESGDFGTSEPIYVRGSCCLYYRAYAGGYCADCPIPQRRPTS